MKRLFIAFLIGLALCAQAGPSLAALAVGNTSTKFLNGSSNTTTWTHDSGVGSERVLYVLVAINNELGSTSITSLTYNSVALTRLGGNGFSRSTVDIWRLIAPATGSNTMSITFNGSAAIFYAAAITFTGADQTTPDGTLDTDQGDGVGTASIDIPSGTGEIGLGVSNFRSGNTATDDLATTGTVFASNVGNANAGSVTCSMAYMDGASPNATMTWNMSAGTGEMGVAGVSVKPSGGGGGGSATVGAVSRRRGSQ